MLRGLYLERVLCVRVGEDRATQAIAERLGIEIRAEALGLNVLFPEVGEGELQRHLQQVGCLDTRPYMCPRSSVCQHGCTGSTLLY